MRVPVAVIDDDSISCSQVDAEAAGFSGQQEDELRRVGGVEPVNGLLPQLPGDATVYPLVPVAQTFEEILQYV